MSTPPKTPLLVNAAALALEHKTTFTVPAAHKRLGLSPGDCAKVCTAGERFWVTVLAAPGPGAYIGRIANQDALVSTPKHHLKNGDAIRFYAVNIYQIEKATQTA